MDILFLAGIYPEADKEAISINSKKGYQFAAQNLQEALVNGFVQNDVNLSIVTFPFLSTFPFGYRKPIVNFGDSFYFNKVHTKCVSFVNIPFLQGHFNSCVKDVFTWYNRSSANTKHILVYSLNVNLIVAAIKVKKKYKDVSLSVIVPDLPEYMGSNSIYKLVGLKKRDIKYIYNNLKHFDQFILLTEAMTTPLGIDKTNFCVVEGIYNHKPISIEEINIEERKKIVLYTGALVKKYGIETLLEAFLLLSNSDYRLMICGDGEAKELVEEYVIKDKRISFLGKLGYEKILALQKSSTLLINPRTPEGEYTKYSFPSKTMEYFASGTPVLMYKLPGVPKEYFNYCYTLDDYSQQALANKIDQLLQLDNEERMKVGKQASQFILEQKNSKIQVGKIINLITKNKKS